MLKIQVKLIAVLLLMIIVPSVVINVVTSNIINDYCMNLHVESVERLIKNHAENINYVCDSTISQAKSFSTRESLRDYIVKTSGKSDGFDFEDPLYLEVVEELSRMSAYSESLIKAIVIDRSGIVLASSSGNDEVGRRVSNYKELYAMALENNGFSGFFMSNENGSQSPVYAIAKSVYSEDNERIGVLYTIYDTYLIQKYINGIKLDKYTVSAVMDSEGTVLEYPYRNLKMYSANENYSAFSQQLKAAISEENTEGIVSVTHNIGKKSNERSYYISEISNSGWYVISSTDSYGLKTTIDIKISRVKDITIIICLVLICLAVAYAMLFVRPIKEIMRVLAEKQKGNVSASFTTNSKDEFSEIGHAVNSMFDNIFESEQRYRTIVEMTNNITFEVNFDKDVVFVSNNFNKKFSFRAKNDTIKESFLYKLRFHKDDRQRYLNDLEKILEKGNFWQGEYRVKSIYGDFIWVMIKGTKFFDRYERPTKIVGVIVDIDREKKSEMHLIQKASYDNLTQLYNRETFLKSLTNELEYSAIKKSLDAVMFIDLDDFKYFNDEFGHACGDEVLKFVADTIKEISFERGFAGRFGGDEFVLCMMGLTLYGDAGKIAQEIIDVVGKGFVSESTGEHLSIKCSIGIAFLRESGKTTEEIVAAADEAMYNIKKHGKSAYAYAKSKNESESSSVTVLAPTTSEIDSDNEPVEEEKGDASESESGEEAVINA